MADRVTFWTRVTIGGVEYPRARGTLRVVETAPSSGAPFAPQGALSFTCELSATDAAELERFAAEVAAVGAARAVLAFLDGLFRLHDGPILTACRRGEVSGPVPPGEKAPEWRRWGDRG